MKYFTICCEANSIRENNWGGRTHYRVERHRSWAEETATGLLFSSDDDTPVTAEEVAAIAEDPKVQELFGNTFFVAPGVVESGVVVTASPRFYPSPDHAGSDDPPLTIFNDGEVKYVNLRKRFNDCREFVKLAMGCGKCPLYGTQCIGKYLGMPPTEVSGEFQNPDKADLKDAFKNLTSQIAGFTYVSPSLTIPDYIQESGSFLHTLRHPSEHDFTQIKANQERRSANASEAANSRWFKQNHCKVCPYKNSCNNFRRCSGAYPEEEAYAKIILERWNERMADKERNPFEPWQFWAIARGADRKTKYQRAEVILEGMIWSGGFRAGIRRNKTNIYRVTSFTDYATVAEMFNLPKTEAECTYGWQRPESDLAVALWFETLELRAAHSKGGWGGTSYEIHFRDLTNTGVNYTIAGPRWRGWNRNIDSFADFYDAFQTKPLAPQNPLTRP